MYYVLVRLRYNLQVYYLSHRVRDTVKYLDIVLIFPGLIADERLIMEFNLVNGKCSIFGYHVTFFPVAVLNHQYVWPSFHPSWLTCSFPEFFVKWIIDFRSPAKDLMEFLVWIFKEICDGFVIIIDSVIGIILYWNYQKWVRVTVMIAIPCPDDVTYPPPAVASYPDFEWDPDIIGW